MLKISSELVKSKEVSFNLIGSLIVALFKNGFSTAWAIEHQMGLKDCQT